MKKHRIQPGIRYNIAQFLLKCLYGRPWHFIGAWPMAGVAAVVFPVHNGRVLLTQRAGKVEYVGCWSGIGGFVEIMKDETYPRGAAREFWEETGLKLDAARFPDAPTFTLLTFHQEKKTESDVKVAVAYYAFEAPENLTDKLTLQEETAAFGWFTEEECRAMIADGRIPADFTDLHEALHLLFSRLKNGWKADPLPIAA
jgi:ADP-ribose pyrophosphatase YjhB (NUDIX family)